MAKQLKKLDKTPDDEIEKRVMSIVGSMRIEGFEMRDELVNDVRGILTGELDARIRTSLAF